MLGLLTDPNAWAALATLTALEIVIGIDNVVFISILVSRCDPDQALLARRIGLSLAFVFRIMMLFALTWLAGLTQPLFSIFANEISWRDIILIGGGLFLIAKATREIHAAVDPDEDKARSKPRGGQSFTVVIAQLVAIDAVFSLDSILTAIGMANQLEVMIAAVILAMIVMYLSSGVVAEFIAKHPTTKMLALAFLLLVGVMLVADGFDFHIPRGYVYFAIAFAGAVEDINVLASRKRR